MSDSHAQSGADVWLLPPDARSAPFFEAAREGRFLLQRCSACRAWMYPVRRRCPECAATDLGWVQASGRGTLYSHGLLRRAYHPRHEGRLPLVLAVVDLEEGVRVNSNLIDAAPETVRAGMKVQVDFETLPDGGVIPVFRPG